MWNLHVIEKAKGLFTLRMSIPKPEDVHTADCGVLSDIQQVNKIAVRVLKYCGYYVVCLLNFDKDP